MSVSKSHAKVRQNFAQMAQVKAETFAIDLADKIMQIPSPDLHVVNGPIKDLDRIFEKANGRYDGNLNEVNDIGRLRILFNDPTQFLAVRDLFNSDQKLDRFNNALRTNGIEIVEFEDNYLEPKAHGYIGSNLIIAIDLGKGRLENFEIQFMHENMQLTDKITHATYEEQRSIIEQADEENRNMSNEEEQIVIGYQVAGANLYKADARHYGLISLFENPNIHDDIINKMQAQLQELQAANNTPAYQDVYAPCICPDIA